MRTPATVVLIHGWLGFRKILWRDYFKGVRPLLEEMELRVIVPGLSWGGGIVKRSGQLGSQLADESGPLHLIAHSMGGLDARRYITHLGGHDKVASLTTLATPHRGSSAADHVLTGHSPFRCMPGVHDLTADATMRLNAATPNHPDVIYRSYSAARPVAEQPWPVRRYGRIIEQAEGANDSQVATASAEWGEHVARLHADHFELIGLNLWLNPFAKRAGFDHLSLYRAIGEWALSGTGQATASRMLQSRHGKYL
ncbi:MAG TPA: alpha/beta hydrolase [Mariprofundaceae bacterium]|nr:alpha/beta hydrolase [Mariprofundaceae bacterium]